MTDTFRFTTYEEAIDYVNHFMRKAERLEDALRRLVEAVDDSEARTLRESWLGTTEVTQMDPAAWAEISTATKAGRAALEQFLNDPEAPDAS